MKQAFLQEIFSSIQGEGPWIGERHIFVRFAGCDIRCQYCDTLAPTNSTSGEQEPHFCNVQISKEPLQYKQIPNPVSSGDLVDFCSNLVIPGPSRPTISLTGGEPLLHHDFLLEFLPLTRKTFRIYLETNGLHAAAMKDLRSVVDVISMDFKLPSATGLQPFWGEHKQFLAAAQGLTLFIKVVVTNATSLDDVMAAAEIIAGFDDEIPFVIQPASGCFAPSAAMLVEFHEAVLKIIQNARVIPQIHKILGIP